MSNIEPRPIDPARPNLPDILKTFIRRSEHTQRMHRFEYELGTPQPPQPNGPVAKVGTASEPAHSDHIHPSEAEIIAYDGDVGIYGGDPGANPLKRIFGNKVINYVTGVGGFSMNFASGGFPTGLLSFLPVIADNTGATSMFIVHSLCDNTKVHMILAAGAVEVGSGLYRIHYQAVGW